MVTAEGITKASTMQAVLDAYPGAQRALMRRYHIGGCSSCGFDLEDRLGDVLARHEVSDADEAIDFIRESDEQEKRIQIAPRELAQELNSDHPPRLIDVRRPEEIAVVSLDGALPVTQTLVDEMVTNWPKDTPIVAYCHHGIRSLDAAAFLIGHGFTNVRSLVGGIDAWAVEIDPSLPRY